MNDGAAAGLFVNGDVATYRHGFRPLRVSLGTTVVAIARIFGVNGTDP